MNSSDAEKLQDEIQQIRSEINSQRGIVDNNADLNRLKQFTREFLLKAKEKNINITFGGTRISSEASIEKALKQYNNGENLKAELNKMLDNISTKDRMEEIKAKHQKILAEEADLKLSKIKGDKYRVDTSIIDYSSLNGYHTDGEIYERGKGWNGSKDKAFQKGIEYLSNDALKNQLKAQITNMLSKEGISFDQIANVFENVYSTTMTDTLNSDGMIYGRGARGLSKKGKAHIDIKNMVDTFIKNFNTNISKSIDMMNQSNKDLDLINLDYTKAGKSAEGTSIKDPASGKDLSQLYTTGETITVRKKGAKYFVKIAENMLERMKNQILDKAKNMCKANGIKFNQSIFNSMFNNAKSIAIENSVEGIDSNGLKHGKGIGLASLSPGAITTATNIAVGASGLLSSATAGIAGGPMGMFLGTTIAGIFGFKGQHSESSFNARILLDTFNLEFENDYSKWVNKEKAENKQ